MMSDSPQWVGARCLSPVVGCRSNKPLPAVGEEGGVARTYENEHLFPIAYYAFGSTIGWKSVSGFKTGIPQEKQRDFPMG